MIILILSFQQSTQKHKVPSIFYTSRTIESQGKIEWASILANISLTYIYRSIS